jgi:hypothetical protein
VPPAKRTTALRGPCRPCRRRLSLAVQRAAGGRVIWRLYHMALALTFGLCTLSGAVWGEAPPRPVGPSTVNEDLLTLCPVITPELQRKIVSEHSVPACRIGCSGCGCKGGPGYRGPDNKCVGYANIIQVCGPPPHAGCVRECAIVREGCVGRAWLRAFAAAAGLAVTFVASETLQPTAEPPAVPTQ